MNGNFVWCGGRAARPPVRLHERGIAGSVCRNICENDNKDVLGKIVGTRRSEREAKIGGRARSAKDGILASIHRHPTAILRAADYRGRGKRLAGSGHTRAQNSEREEQDETKNN